MQCHPVDVSDVLPFPRMSVYRAVAGREWSAHPVDSVDTIG